MIALIWAMDALWLIGKDNRLPWHLPKDLAYFKKMTQQKTVLMGDLTYQSLKSYYKDKPLPFGKMYVANQENTRYSDALCITDIHAFLKDAKEDLFVIGGRTIYQLALPYATDLYITYVLGCYQGNVYFPSFDLSHRFKLNQYVVEEHMIFSHYKRKVINHD